VRDSHPLGLGDPDERKGLLENLLNIMYGEDADVFERIILFGQNGVFVVIGVEFLAEVENELREV
jgi:hypothetical protein